MAGNPDFDVFKLPDEHNELRAVMRDLWRRRRSRRTPPTSTRKRASPRRR